MTDDEFSDVDMKKILANESTCTSFDISANSADRRTELFARYYSELLAVAKKALAIMEREKYRLNDSDIYMAEDTEAMIIELTAELKRQYKAYDIEGLKLLHEKCSAFPVDDTASPSAPSTIAPPPGPVSPCPPG